MLKNAVVILALVLACPTVSVGQTQARLSGRPGDHEQAIRAHYAEGVAAELAGDLKRFANTFASDWRVTNNGIVATREQFFDLLNGHTWTRDDVTISNINLVSADTIIATAVGRSAGAYNGKQFESTDALTDVFVRRDGKWVCVASHWSRLPDAPKK